IKGVVYEIGTRAFPTFTKLFNDLSRWLLHNRRQIADWATFVANKAIQTINDLDNIFRGQDHYVKQSWLLDARDRIRECGDWVRTAIRFSRELFYALTGRDEQVQEFLWLIELRDQVIATFNEIVARVQAMYQTIIAVA